MAEFPDLAEVMPDKKIRLKVRLYKYSRSSTAQLLGLNDGGSSLLSKFIAAYKRETSHFIAPWPTNPVVILYDNDTGARSILEAIKKNSKTLPIDAEPFVHVIKNMYAVPTPGADSKIEGFFDDTIQKTVISGKTFNDGKGFKSDQHYSKKVFAHRVVRPKANTIDFTGFRPLLTNLVAAINKHKSSIIQQPPAL